MNWLLVIFVGSAKAIFNAPKAPLVPSYEPQTPMEFVSMDVAYMPQDVEGYRYVLLIGDLFSKYIEVVPLRDQTSLTISQAFWESWLSVHGCPKYLLTDQGSKVDGDVVNDI